MVISGLCSLLSPLHHIFNYYYCYYNYYYNYEYD